MARCCGAIDLLPEAELAIRGRVFDVINLPNGLVQVSPNVRVVLRERQFQVSGEVLVPRAEIRLKEIAESAVQPSADTVVHGRSQTVVEQAPALFVLDGLRVRLGEKVSFEGFGLKTRLTGEMSLSHAAVPVMHPRRESYLESGKRIIVRAIIEHSGSGIPIPSAILPHINAAIGHYTAWMLQAGEPVYRINLVRHPLPGHA